MEKLLKIKKYLGKLIPPLLVVTLFLIILIGVLYRVTNHTFYFFNNRFDVVLSESMSIRNDKYKDFLKDTSQIQKNDFVVASKVNESTPLSIYDVVIFNNPSIGTDMHRIVNVGYDGQFFEFKSMNYMDFYGHSTFYAIDPTFSIKLTNNYSFSKMEAVIYTKNEPFDTGEYYFNTNTIDDPVEVVSELIDDTYYRNIVTLDKGTAILTKFSITRKSFSYKAYFESVRLFGGFTECNIDTSIMDNRENFEYICNPIEKYEIRGDASNTSDGWFYRNKIYAKVHTVIPKFGIFVGFITSPFGIIMVVGLALIPPIYTYLSHRSSKKKEGK